MVNPDETQAVLLNGYRYIDAGIVLSLPVTSGDYGTMVELPLSVSNVTGLLAADVTITFASNVLSVQDVQAGALAFGWALSYNTSPAGTLTIRPTSMNGSPKVAGLSALSPAGVSLAGSSGWRLRTTN